jgi:hypothetical protein
MHSFFVFSFFRFFFFYLNQIREILQANRDPLSNISGLSGTPEQVLSKSYEQVQQLMEIITQTANSPQRETANALAAARKTFEVFFFFLKKQ